MATYPIALLSYQSKVGATISQTRERRHPMTKKMVKATWKVLGSEEYGLPTASDDAVVMVLLELSREQRFPREVTFSRYDLIRRLGWPYNSSSYNKVERAFERLNALTIQSKNVFWDDKAQSFVTTGFHLIEEFKLIVKPGRRKTADEESLSWFRWGEPLWFSFRDGNLKPISLDFYFSLGLPIARRLYRFLDLVRYDGKPRYRIGLRKLCEEYLALTPQKYLSQYKVALEGGHKELVAAGYLRRVSYEEAKDGGENVIYDFEPRESAREVGKDGPRALATEAGDVQAPQVLGAGTNDASRSVSLDVALSLAHGDADSWAEAADSVLAGLSLAEQEQERALAVAALPPFLRAELNSSVAHRMIQGALRARVREHHSRAVEAALEAKVRAQYNEERESEERESEEGLPDA